MNIPRFMRHLFATRWMTRRRFPAPVLEAIEKAIRQAEARHAGEIRFVIETALDLPELLRELPSRQRALQVFSLLGVWDTEHNNGVLIYLLLADRVVEIVADRGIAAGVAQAEWDTVCRAMEEHFRAGRFAEGSESGIRQVGELLARHFPSPRGAGGNELPNQPVLL